MLSNLVYTVMSQDDSTHHIFLLDLTTENYTLIRTLERTSRQEALEHAQRLANSTPENLHSDVQRLGRQIDKQIEKEDREDGIGKFKKEK